jgi:hypothetical protein
LAGPSYAAQLSGSDEPEKSSRATSFVQPFRAAAVEPAFGEGLGEVVARRGADGLGEADRLGKACVLMEVEGAAAGEWHSGSGDAGVGQAPSRATVTPRLGCVANNATPDASITPIAASPTTVRTSRSLPGIVDLFVSARSPGSWRTIAGREALRSAATPLLSRR